MNIVWLPLQECINEYGVWYFRQYAASIERPFEVYYDPYTETVQVLDSKESIQDLTRIAHAQLACLQNALRRIDSLAIEPRA